jgi:hypothetical protein
LEKDNRNGMLKNVKGQQRLNKIKDKEFSTSPINGRTYMPTENCFI